MSTHQIKAFLPGVREEAVEPALRSALEQAGLRLVEAQTRTWKHLGAPPPPGQRIIRWRVNPVVGEYGSVLCLWEAYGTNVGWDLHWWRTLSGCLGTFLVGIETWPLETRIGAAAFLAGQTLEIDAWFPIPGRLLVGSTSPEFPSILSTQEEYFSRYRLLCDGLPGDLMPEGEIADWRVVEADNRPAWTPEAGPPFTRVLFSERVAERIEEVQEQAPWLSWLRRASSAFKAPFLIGSGTSFDPALVGEFARHLECDALGFELHGQSYRWVEVSNGVQREGKDQGFLPLVNLIGGFAVGMGETAGMLPL